MSGPSRRRRRWNPADIALRAALVLLVFALGIALGEALHDNPRSGGTVTLEHTLRIPIGGARGSTISP